VARSCALEAKKCPEAQRLMTHPGVGALTALAFVFSRLLLRVPTRTRAAPGTGRSEASHLHPLHGMDPGVRHHRLLRFDRERATHGGKGRRLVRSLLSFAQFEREVTGERIRDKIAASKRKGMWTGGRVPLGYVLKERKLVRNPEEAKLVEQIYRLYVELGCVSKLKARLDADGVKSKIRISTAGTHSGGACYARGALYKILENRVYVGETVHRKQHYPGEHEALIPRELWDRVQGQLRNHTQGRRSGTQSSRSSLLLGLLQDSTGNRYVPSHTVRRGRRYRYYVLSRHDAEATDGPKRVPAHEIENVLIANLQSLLNSGQRTLDQIGRANDPAARTQRLLDAACSLSRSWHSMPPAQVREFLRKVLRRVVVHEDKVEALISRRELRAMLLADQHFARESPANDTPRGKIAAMTCSVSSSPPRYGAAAPKCDCWFPRATHLRAPCLLS
jgi:hypothetical protein